MQLTIELVSASLLKELKSSTESYLILKVLNMDICALRTCGECRMDTGCGFCYNDLGNQGVSNGSCLVTSPDDWQRSADGRCDQYKLRDNGTSLVWAYDFCPTQYYWLPMVGLVMYLVFFAPGMTILSFAVGFHAKLRCNE